MCALRARRVRKAIDPLSGWSCAGHAAHLWHAIHHCQIFEQQCAHATPQRVNIIFAASFISRLLIYFPSTETNPIPATNSNWNLCWFFSCIISYIYCGPRGRPILAPSLMEPQIDYTLFCIVMDMEAHNGKGARAMQTRRFSKSNRTPLNGAAGVKSWYQKVSNWHSLAFSHTYIYLKPGACSERRQFCFSYCNERHEHLIHIYIAFWYTF